MKQRRHDSVNQWVSEPMHRWTNQSLNQINQWINEPVNQWINDPKNQWVHESRSQWINECVNEWMGGEQMNGVSSFSAELLLHWASSSPRYLFSQPLLLWAASYLGYFCFELPPSYLFRIFGNPILPFAQPAQGVLQPPAALPHSANVALCWNPTSHAVVALRFATSSCNLA